MSPENQPDGKLRMAVKLLLICVICFGAIYGMVSLIAALTQ